MKKLLIMFVMLLGSVATMQAQTFDFSCLSTSAPGYGQTFVPAAFTQAQADVLFAIGLETSSNDPHFTYPIMIGDASLLIEEVNGSYSVYDADYGDDFIALQNASFEDAVAYANTLVPQGFTIDQSLDLVADGIVFTTIPAANGCMSCVSKRRFQGAFRANNGDVQTFILAASREGATHEVYNDDFTVLLDSAAPHNYSITGRNFTTEYFLDIDIAIARAMELNTRD